MSAQLKRALIAKVHIAKKDLALDDSSYRGLLSRVTGRESCAGMTIPQLKNTVEEFKSLGWEPKNKPKRAGTRKLATGAQASKIRAFWLSLYHLGEVKDPSEDALASFVRRMTNVHDLNWLTPAKADIVIRAFHNWAYRIGWCLPTGRRHDSVGAIKASLIRLQCEILEVSNWQEYLTGLGYDLEKIHKDAVDFNDFEGLDKIIEDLGAKIRRLK